MPTTCPKPDCNYQITLRVSRGTANQNNRGYWYEVCTAPVPGTSHFIKWRRDMDRQEIATFPGSSLQPIGGFPTLQSILETMAPTTPMQTPARDHDVPKSAYSTPSKRPRAKPSPPILPSISESLADNVIDTVARCPSPLPVEVPGESEADPSGSHPEPCSTTLSSTVVNRPPDLSSPPEPEHTRIVVKGGKSFVACNGPVCRSHPSKDPVRNCKTCTHSFCKKCCIRFQKDGATQCAHPAHHFDAKGSDEPTLPGTDDFSTSEYNIKRPLRKDHYEARENAQQKWEVKANNLIQKRVAEDSLRSNVKLIYWKNDSEEPDVIDIPCPTFPFFTLNSCSAATLAVLGIEKGAERPDILIDTFNPFDGTNGRWNKHTLSTSRNVSKFQALLYRAPNVSSTAVDMKSEIDKLVEMLKPRKRIADSDPFESPKPSKRRILDVVNNQSPRKAIKLEPVTVEISSDSDSSSEFPSPPQLTPEIFKSKTVRLSKVKNRSKSAAHSSIRTKKSRDKIVELSSGSDSEDDSTRATQASSLHASWPLKYVRPMAEGFAKMETMGTGTLAERFRSSFGLPFPSSKATWSTHSNIWNAATAWQRREFIDAGYTEHGLWKTFARDVREKYPDGKVPGKRSNNERKGKRRSTGKLVQVKKENESIKIKTEPDSDIIVIDSDD